MDFDLDSMEFDFPCPKCGVEFKETIARLKQNPTIECPNCHQSIEVDSGNLNSEIAKAQQALDAFADTIKKLG